MALLPLPLVIAIGSLVLSGLAGRIASRPRLIAGPLAVAAGFLLLLRIGGHNAHGSTVLPGTFVAALGMAYAVAPLTSAAVGSVDERYSSLAQGFNTAVARAGLVATSSIGGILAARGSVLVDAVFVAVVANVVAYIAAAAGLMPKRPNA